MLGRSPAFAHGYQPCRPLCTERATRMQSIRLQAAEQWKLMLACQGCDLCNLGLGDLIGVDSCYSDPLVMDMQHDSHRISFRSLKDGPKYKDDKFHRGIVVIVQQYLVKRRPLQPRLTFGNNCFVALRIQIRHTPPADLRGT